MSYPEHLGPDPELPTSEHFARFRAKLARLLFRQGEVKRRPMVEEHDFSLIDSEHEQYYSVHHERYNTPRPIPPNALSPKSWGEVTIVMIPGKRRQELPHYYAMALYPARDDSSEKPWKDCVRLDQTGIWGTGEDEFHLKEDVRSEVRQFFREHQRVPAGTETFVVRPRSVEDMIGTLEPEEFALPAPSSDEIEYLHAKVRCVLKLIGHSETDY